MNIEHATPIAAFAAGLATSLHCVGMCGPLACAFKVRPLQYHGGRLLSYTAAGALCGVFGQLITRFLSTTPLRLAPILMALVLIALAFGIEKRIPQPRWISRLMIQARFRKHLGFLTVLLPCGPIWLMLGVAASTSSSLNGAVLLASFVVGTIPLFAFAQSSAGLAQRRLSPVILARVQRTIALAAAVLLVWRVSTPAGVCCH